ncbi:MAG: cyclic nucleotide-binding domain-containing protein [Acidobacteria bacterium]|nr:cyclic nucleotide-binding domain-containing protein [Acidobacteriota bacterium]
MHQTLEPIMAEQPFLKGLDAEHLQLLVGCASNVRYEAGQYLLRESEEANQFYIIRHGRVAIEVYTPNRGPIVIETLGEGDVLGWSWLVPPYNWRFDARAIELTRAIVLDGKCLRGKCEQDYQLGYELLSRFLQIIERRLQATRLQLLDVYKD